jgi:16S rRNA (guanine(966)-N(2))-methyltransferase RsmD
MRIIAGRHKSRRLVGSPPADVRPTSDRLRETLFNILSDRVIESVFLDAYAGVGGVGLEAISRGATQVFFVDRSATAVGLIRSNLQTLEVRGGFRVLKMDLDAALRGFVASNVVFDIAFLDPPYREEELYVRDLETFGEQHLLVENGLLVLEHSRKMYLPDEVGRLRRTRSLRQGDSVLTFYKPERGTE